MTETAKAKSPAKKKKVQTWSQTTKIGDKNKEVRVEKLNNQGFLVEYRLWGEDDKGKWFDKSVKEYSDENPLQPETEPSLGETLRGVHEQVL